MPEIIETNDAPRPALRSGMLPGHERLNASLRPMLLEMAARVPDKGTNRARGGESYFVNKWLSDQTLHLLPDPAIQEFVQLVVDNARRVAGPSDRQPPLRIMTMWAIVSRQGMEGRPHNHRGRVSGAYYVDSGDCDDGGNGAFAIYHPNGEQFRLITPRTGMMLMFPSNLMHGVTRYEGDRPRIVISFNLA